MFDRARQAIEAGDFDLGFELVEDDWKLKFPQADPQLASLEQQALEQSRARQQVLAAAAPQAYHDGNDEGDQYGADDEAQDGSGDSGYGGGGYGGGAYGGGIGWRRRRWFGERRRVDCGNRRRWRWQRVAGWRRRDARGFW